MAHIAHSDTMSTFASSAASVGSRSGATNAISAKRRAGSPGHSVSAMAATFGRVISAESTTAGAI